ncbi:MAG: hypothetical protein HWE09_09095 [Cyclobacteriaceae bacterium]|nr:hypothetical protein [Cyclobacteriaceae bacterium]
MAICFCCGVALAHISLAFDRSMEVSAATSGLLTNKVPNTAHPNIAIFFIVFILILSFLRLSALTQLSIQF